ncbi:MAG: Protein kinase protein [Anaerolineales bacterium]|nr:Protein kinase protein [Anaerolineales bacterium]
MSRPGPPAWMDRFGEREIEILRLMTEGLSNREISQRLSLSPETVKWYNKQLFSKLGVTSRARAAAAAADYGLLTTPQASGPERAAIHRSNLPAQVTSYVGRAKEVGEVKQLLKSSRLVVLTGAGGTGKTRLALQVAGDLQGHYREGVWLVELATISQPDLVAHAIGRVFELDLPGGAASVDGLKRFLTPKHLLLFLDNFEHLLGAAPLVGELLAVAPQLTVLATSRERLHVYGEQEYSVQPLQLPDLGPTSAAEKLVDNEAVDLFLQRARAADPRLGLNDDQVVAAARICLRLDGLPLAIELAASQVRMYPPAILAQRLEASFQALPSGPRDVPARQRTLRATLDWSHQLLSEKEQTLFARLSVFQGGGTLESIEQVCGVGLAGRVSEALGSLVEKNLVLPREPHRGELRFAMLETIREYALERLTLQGEAEPARLRHASHFTELSEHALREFRTSRNLYWMDRLRAENDNLRSALGWSLQGGEGALGVQMAASLRDHWYYNGLAAEGQHWAGLALDRSKSMAPAVRAGVLATAGDLAYVLNDLPRARGLLGQGLAIYLEAGDERQVAWCKARMSITYIQTADEIREGFVLAQEALDKFRELGDKPGTAEALNLLGELARVEGNYPAAKRYYEECLETVKDTGERFREAVQYDNLGIVAYHQGNPELAQRLLKQALAIFQEFRSHYFLAMALTSLAGPTAALGRPRRAALLLSAAAAHLEFFALNLFPADLPEITLFLESVRPALSEDQFRAAWQAGQRMSLQDAVSYALSDADDSE